MTLTSNKTLVYTKLPVRGLPVPGEHMRFEDRPLDPEACPPGGLTVKILRAAFDPYLRDRMRDPSVVSYAPPFTIGEPIVVQGIGRIVTSKLPDFAPGDLVTGILPVAEYAVLPPNLPAVARPRKLVNPGGRLPLSLFCGPLGMPGLTAYSSFYGICEPAAGRTIWISAASGAVGQVVGQLAKREGMRVIGSAGSDEKVRFVVDELGFDAAFNYKTEAPRDALPRLAPDGLDVYYDNVGGDHLEAAIDNMKWHGRIVCCGYVSQYNTPRSEQYGVKNLGEIFRRRLTLKGFIVSDDDMALRYGREHQEKMQPMIGDGSFKVKMSDFDGLDKAPEAFLSVFDGKSFGKAVVRVSD